MFIIKLKARKFSIPLIVLCIFIGLDAQTKNERLIEKKQRLQELLGLEPDGSLKEDAFEILSQNLESLGIEDNELIDGYEFIGGYWGFQEYLDNNIDRLLKVLGDEGGSEFWEEEEEYVDDEEYEDDGEYEEDGKMGKMGKMGNMRMMSSKLMNFCMMIPSMKNQMMKMRHRLIY